MGRSKAKALSKVYDRADSIPFDPEKEKYVVFSDCHIGMPEFDENMDLYLHALDYYFEKGFKLIITGDYEELHRYGIQHLKEKYGKVVYPKERKFLQEGRYYRMFGNHDIDWKVSKRVEKHLHDVMPGLKIVEGLRLEWKGNSIFLTHGHQGDIINDKLGIFGRILLRWIARPFGFSSGTSPAKNYRKRRKDETEYYNWAKNNKVLFIAGHTHRPMFASLAEADSLRIDIENLLRQYIHETNPNEKEKIRDKIKTKKMEFNEAIKDKSEKDQCLRLGEVELFTPSYFNDGSCLHKSGITCIELCETNIRLVLLYDKSKKRNEHKDQRAWTIPLLPGVATAANYMYQILEEDKLEYVFARIQFLS